MTKNWFRQLLVGLILLFFGAQVQAHHSQTLVVGDGGANCPEATFTHIQDAINQASPGMEVHVCAGIYDEVIQIIRPLILTADPGAILIPQYLLPNASSLATGNPLSAILSAKGVSGVSVSGLTVDASLAAISECAPDLIGVLFQNSSGTIEHLTVRNTKLATSLNGCQSGLGIFVQSGNGGSSEVLVANNRVEGYQKNGITANEIGTQVKITENNVIGLGPTSGAAQNGIQVGYGASGEIVRNFVVNNIWSPCLSPTQCEFFSTGILVEQSDGIKVIDNTVGNNQVNIFEDGNECEIRRNRVYGSVVLGGIEIAGDDCHVDDNRVVNSALASIVIFGNGGHVNGNTLVAAPIGVWESSASLGTIIAGNKFIDVGTEIVDPNLSPLDAGAAAPARD